MKLHEISNRHVDLMDKVKEFLAQPEHEDIFKIDKVSVNTYGSLDVDGAVYLQEYQGTELPFKFGTVQYSFDCNNAQLTSMKNFPIRVGTYFSIHRCKNITSLEGLPQYVGSSGLYMSEAGITSFENTYDIFSNLRFTGAGSIVFNSRRITKGGLSLLFVLNLADIGEDTYEATEPFEIIKKYLNQPDRVFECQAELIEKGFEEYAVL